MHEPAEQLRASAQRLRELAGAATKPPWISLDDGDRIIRDPDATAREDDSDPCGEGPPLDAVARDMADNVTLPGYAWAEASNLARLVLEAK